MEKNDIRRQMEKTPIEGVIFDFGNVLSLPQEHADIQNVAQVCGLRVEQFHRSYWKFRTAYDRGELNGTSYWTAVIAEANNTANSEKIAELISLDIQSWLRINDGAVRWVEQLRRFGTRLGILSNMPAELARYIESNCPWISYFTAVIFSCDWGCAKPESEVYRLCLSRLNMSAEKVLFIDDREENVAAAVRLGMHGLVFESIVQARRQVEDLFDFQMLVPANRPAGGI